MKRPLFTLSDPETMARVRRAIQEDQQSEGSNIIVATRRPNTKPQYQEQDQHSIPPAPSTRIPETPLQPPDRRPAERRHTSHPPSTAADEAQHLRIRNLIQREEIRSANHHTRQAFERMDQMETEATRQREELLRYREELRTTRVWMEVSMFLALVVVICAVLYAVWCWFNRAEFEFQKKVLRRNLGLG